MSSIMLRTQAFPLRATAKSPVLVGYRSLSYASKKTTARGVATTRVLDIPTVQDAKEHRVGPLSKLSPTSLARSMLISFVCSKPYLLGPSIAFLNLLCRPKNLFLFDVNRNKPLRWLLKNLLYRQFCTGENSVEVKRTMNELRDLGFKGTILTYAKETTFDQSTQSANGFGVSSEEENAVSGICSNIEAWRQGTLNTVRMLGQGDQLALK